ncbi:hypothetical protein HRI_002745600 [Hibiscus trionum]|uniref:WRKY domain-containing protein n=1 Tax=Hibiscus trionum TaxID=183268 RepID=A0A9W7I891_HIBTR|nr:hypothetical protein HRI_002745600 [Hibiscus trionum]
MSSSDITTTTTTFLTPSSTPNPMELNGTLQPDFEDFLLLPDHPQTHTETHLSPVNGGCWDWEVPNNSACVDYMLQTTNEDVGKFKIAFRTKSGVEVMDDGYTWRKYGKKKIKSNPNPRHYFRCSRQGCNVKKRVEKEGEDGHFVITTYEGKHNHESPATLPAALPQINTLHQP